MKVLFLTNLPSPYRVDFFNELGNYCELTVLYETGESRERDKRWKTEIEQYTYKSIFLSTIMKFDACALSLEVIKYLDSKKYDIIIVCGNSTPTNILAISYLKKNRIPYVFESDGGIAKNDVKFKKWVKKKITSGATMYLSSGKMNDDYLLSYGAEQNRILHYPFTSIRQTDVMSSVINSHEKRKLKAKLDIKEKYAIVSVGRFSYRGGYGKGYDTLLKAAKDISQDVGIYIIGDEPTEEFIELKENNKLNHVHYVGFKKKMELQEYYKAADLFVLMTISDVWGLVINEAMSTGLPIITTTKCGAGKELVNDDENGFLINVGDVSALVYRIKYILDNEELRIKMSEDSLKKIEKYTIEEMVRAHVEAFNVFLKQVRD